MDDPSHIHFTNAITALRRGDLSAAEREFKAVLSFSIPGDVAVMTNCNLGQINFNSARVGFNQNIPLVGMKLENAKRSCIYFERAMELAKQYPTSTNFPDYASMLRTLENNLTNVSLYLSGIGEAENRVDHGALRIIIKSPPSL